MSSIKEAVKEVYRRLPKMETATAKEARVALQGVDKIVDYFWKGWPCGGDVFLAHVLRGAEAYIQSLKEAKGVVGTEEEQEHLYMLLMLWFASGRTDLAENLLAEDRELDKEDAETLRLQWRNIGFPMDIRDKLRDEIREGGSR